MSKVNRQSALAGHRRDGRFGTTFEETVGVTLEELDNHKKGMSEVARNARQISRSLDALVSDVAEDSIDLGIGDFGVDLLQQFAVDEMFHRIGWIVQVVSW